MADEMSREEFLRLAVAELRKQGVKAGGGDKGKAMVRARATAEDAFEALNYDMPRLAGVAARNLAAAMQAHIDGPVVRFPLSPKLIRVRLFARMWRACES